VPLPLAAGIRDYFVTADTASLRQAAAIGGLPPRRTRQVDGDPLVRQDHVVVARALRSAWTVTVDTGSAPSASGIIAFEGRHVAGCNSPNRRVRARPCVLAAHSTT
jgi:hypothetical protein